MEMTKEQLDIVWGVIHRECERLGIFVICGHTARYENCHYPMVGGATVLAIGGKDEYVTPKFARAGDKIIITKGPAIEASGILATMFPRHLERKFGADFSRRAESIFYKMSAVEDALTAVSVGVRDNGVSAMHDATECGIWGGLYELAQAANLGVRVEKEAIVVEDCVPEICRYSALILCLHQQYADCLPASSRAVVEPFCEGIRSRLPELMIPNRHDPGGK
jgi:hydrogenase maturation factor